MGIQEGWGGGRNFNFRAAMIFHPPKEKKSFNYKMLRILAISLGLAAIVHAQFETDDIPFDQWVGASRYAIIYMYLIA